MTTHTRSWPPVLAYIQGSKMEVGTPKSGVGPTIFFQPRRSTALVDPLPCFGSCLSLSSPAAARIGHGPKHQASRQSPRQSTPVGGLDPATDSDDLAGHSSASPEAHDGTAVAGLVASFHVRCHNTPGSWFTCQKRQGTRVWARFPGTCPRSATGCRRPGSPVTATSDATKPQHTPQRDRSRGAPRRERA